MRSRREAQEDRGRRLAQAWRSFERGKLAEAQQRLESLVHQYPEFADAHADLAEVEAALGHHQRCIERLLEVRRLDAQQDHDAGLDLLHYQEFITNAARRTLNRLPREFRDKLEGVPILLEERPSLELVREGFHPRSLGLFEGLDHQGHLGGEPAMLATRIVLYGANLIAVSDDESTLAHEVEVTVLHEVGHYFGLDEDDMARLGLA